MVGAVRFELTTSCTRNKRASQTTLRPDTEPFSLADREWKAIGNSARKNSKLPGVQRAIGVGQAPEE
jgi:hypothetical protein